MTQILTVFEDIICTLRYINQAIVMINRYFVTYFLLHEITTQGEKILEKDFCWTIFFSSDRLWGSKCLMSTPDHSRYKNTDFDFRIKLRFMTGLRALQ